MKLDRTKLTELIAAVLVLLWVYAAVSKLAIYPEFKEQLSRQPLPKSMIRIIAVTLPITELIAAWLLCANKTRVAGLKLSVFLLVMFSVYVGLILNGHFTYVPCACGGVLSGLGWRAHFYFNLCLTALAITGLGLAIYHGKGGRPAAP